jgi:error-prone DNA polymerase
MPPPSLPAYAELHCISNFSFLRGASHPEELVGHAARLGYSALALTDECSLAGAVRAFIAAREVQLPLILGTELRLDDGLHLVLLATDRTGYGNLSELISTARRQAPKGRYRLQLEHIERYAGHCLLIWANAEHCHPNAAHNTASWIRNHFPAHAWLGVNRRLDGRDAWRLQTLTELSTRSELPLVACGAACMHTRRRRMLKDTLTAIRRGLRLQDAGFALPCNAERYLRSRTRLHQLYPRHLLDETLSIAARCRFSLGELRYEYPEELVPPGCSPSSHLRRLTEAGLQARWPQTVPAKIRALVEHELALIAELRYEAYFLTVHDIVRFARSRNILCQGRGSAANSAVCYCLGITEVDPSRIETLFERFISKQRNEPPDIDVDFEHQRREEVIQYIYEKYGRERAALAATVISYRPRSAVRDVGKALGFDSDQIDRLSQIIHWRDGGTMAEQRLRDAGLDPASPLVRRLLQLVNQLVGFPRHLSQHVGGFVIARDALNRMVPIENAAMPARTVIQWDKDDLDALGLLKVDCLGLGMLSAIHHCFDLVAQHHGVQLSMAQIPAEEPRVYDMISRADTIGVFQIESRAQMSMLPRLRPACFYDLVIEVAIVRPGPIQGNMVHPYLQRRQGLEPVSYPSPEVRSVLERTLGIPIFQEQVIRLAIVAAGFSPGEAEQLRRSMAAWRRHGQILAFEQRLIDGMRRHGYSETFAQQLFKQILGFGEYGFPESHSASFALLVYVSAWLKHHYPAAFTCALLNSQPMGFYTARQLVEDLRRHGGDIRPVDVLHSDWQCTLEKLSPTVSDQAGEQDCRAPHCAVRLGLQMVKGLSHDGAARLVEARTCGAFRGVADLARRSRIDRGDLEALAAAGALATLVGHRYQARWACAGIEPERPLLREAAPLETEPALRPPSEGETLVADYASLGLSLGRHPLALLRTKLTGRGLCSAGQVLDRAHGSYARTAGLVTTRQSPDSASGTMFITLEDETGMTQVVVWPRLVQRQRSTLLRAQLLAVGGEIQREGEVIHLIAKQLHDYSHLLGRLTIHSRDFH